MIDARARVVRRLGVLTVGVLVVDACQTTTLPSAPSDLTEGVIVYEHANYLGRSAHITSNIESLAKFDGPCSQTVSDGETTTTIDSWDECISSIRVAPGWRATLYEDRGFRGWAADVGEENVANYQLVAGPCRKDKRDTFNDCASSIRVFRKSVIP